MKGFYHIWAWRSSWSCDQDITIKIQMPLSKEAPHKISTRSAKRFQRRRSLKLWTTTTDGWTDDGRTDGRRIMAILLAHLVSLRPSFDQTMMGWSPKYYIPSFMKIGQPVLEKKIFEWFLPYMGVAAILVM